MKLSLLPTWLAVFCLAWLPQGGRADVLLSLEEFQARAFPDVATEEIEKKSLWLNREQRQQAADIMRNSYRGIRVNYWQNNQRTAWVLEEIGKEELITFGVVVDAGAIADAMVLVYRESRGGEIKYPFFTEQFLGLTLEEKKQSKRLSDDIDGITGATLSVRAVTRLATLALYFHQQIFAQS